MTKTLRLQIWWDQQIVKRWYRLLRRRRPFLRGDITKMEDGRLETITKRSQTTIKVKR